MTIRVSNSVAATVNAGADWMTTPTHGVLWANGVAIDSAAFSTTIEQPEMGDAVTFAVGTLQFDNVIASMNEPGVKEVFDAAVEAGTITWKVSLHDGAPGSGYTNNELQAGEANGYVPGNAGRITLTVQVTTV